MKKIIPLIIFLFLVSFLYSADCNTSFTDGLNVRVLDAMNRPLANVSITVYYQLSSSTGKGYATTNPKLTAENGTMYIKIQNLEEQEGHLDCNVKIMANYGGEYAEKTVTANAHPSLIDLKLDVYTLVVTVKDQNNAKLEGALISSDLFEAYTNKDGWASLRLGTGEKTLYTRYRGAEAEDKISFYEDMNYEVSFFLSDLILTVIDDNGNPLQAAVVFETEEYETDANGEVIIPDIGLYEPEITVKYGNKEKVPDVDLSREDEYIVVFDSTSPVITSVKNKEENGVTKLNIVIDDQGGYASGVNAESLSVYYDSGNGWKQAVVYSKGGNLYVAELGNVPEETVVFFEIYVEDNDGNSITQNGEYSTVSTNGGGNQDDSGDQEPDGEELDICGLAPMIVGGIIILIILYFIYKKFISKEE